MLNLQHEAPQEEWVLITVLSVMIKMGGPQALCVSLESRGAKA